MELDEQPILKQVNMRFTRKVSNKRWSCKSIVRGNKFREVRFEAMD